MTNQPQPLYVSERLRRLLAAEPAFAVYGLDTDQPGCQTQVSIRVSNVGSQISELEARESPTISMVGLTYEGERGSRAEVTTMRRDALAAGQFPARLWDEIVRMAASNALSPGSMAGRQASSWKSSAASVRVAGVEHAVGCWTGPWIESTQIAYVDLPDLNAVVTVRQVGCRHTLGLVQLPAHRWKQNV